MYGRSTDNILSRNRFILMNDSEKFSMLMKQSASSRFARTIQSFLRSLCNQVNSYLRSKNRWWTLKVRTDMLYLPRVYLGLRRYRFDTWNIPHEVALSLWERYQCRIITCCIPQKHRYKKHTLTNIQTPTFENTSTDTDTHSQTHERPVTPVDSHKQLWKTYTHTSDLSRSQRKNRFSSAPMKRPTATHMRPKQTCLKHH